jgi:hypothetical protein
MEAPSKVCIRSLVVAPASVFLPLPRCAWILRNGLAVGEGAPVRGPDTRRPLIRPSATFSPLKRSDAWNAHCGEKACAAADRLTNATAFKAVRHPRSYVSSTRPS